MEFSWKIHAKPYKEVWIIMNIRKQCKFITPTRTSWCLFKTGLGMMRKLWTSEFYRLYVSLGTRIYLKWGMGGNGPSLAWNGGNELILIIIMKVTKLDDENKISDINYVVHPLTASHTEDKLTSRRQTSSAHFAAKSDRQSLAEHWS